MTGDAPTGRSTPPHAAATYPVPIGTDTPPLGPGPTHRAGLLQPDPVPEDVGGTTRAGYLLDAVRLRPAGRRLLTLVSVVLFLVGLGVFAFPLTTDIYTTQLVQRPLADQFISPEIVQRYTTRTIETGDPLTRMIIPSLDVDTVVVQGTSPAALRAGAGHYPGSPLPGEAGNVAIAGHRTTYGKPFNALDTVPVGAEIRLVTPLSIHTYRVVPAPSDAAQRCPNDACWIIDPTNWEVVGPLDGAMLTLTTCHPKNSFAERLILRAELVDSEPRSFDTEGNPVPLDQTAAGSDLLR